jgi:multicomponent Na+:H+ antiporter subunit D
VDLIFVGFFAVLALGIGLYAVSVPQGGPVWWGLATAIVVLVIAGELTGNSLVRTILLDFAELAGVALVWSQATAQAAVAARVYLYSILPAIACSLIAFALMAAGGGNRPGPALESLVVCLVIVGFALKLGLIPFYFWVPAVAAAAAPMTTALIVSVVDIATFAELAAMRQISPWIFTEHASVWMVVALVSMFGGALLALAQTELKRMLAFSTIADLGFLLVGLIAGGSLGVSGAGIGALSHALSKVILFGAVGLAEARIGRTVTLDTSGLCARLPMAGAAFIVGALSFIGVPPGFGFGGYWRIYIAASQFGGGAMIAALLAAAALDLLCYARAIHRTWLGPAQIPLTGAPTYLAPGVLTLLAVAAILLGCYPSVLTRAIVPSSLAMTR